MPEAVHRFEPPNLGIFAEGVRLWPKMIATAAPDMRPTVFRNCIAEGALFVANGAPRALIADALIERAELHELVADLGGHDAVEAIVAEGLAGKNQNGHLDEAPPAGWVQEPFDIASRSPPPPMPWISMATWDTDPIPEQDWTVRERFPRRQCALFSGEGSAGKSTLLLQLCASTAIARDWLGTMPEMGPSLFVDAEDDEDVIHRRLAAIVKHYGTTFAELASGGLHLMSLAGCDAVMATASKGGKVIPTPLYEQLLQACGDLKPQIIGMASSANFFAGNEVDRAQVQQFISMMTKLAIVANGSTVLVSHPSLSGISSDSGLSGNTQWHNSVRARAYIRGVKREQQEGEATESDHDLKEIFWKKSNYGPVSSSVVVKWEKGLFLPIKGVSSLDQLADASKADDVFLTVLKRLTRENRFVSNKPSVNYAPTVFAAEDEARKAGTGKVALHAAMLRLFQAGVIYNLSYGRAARSSFRIAVKGV